MTSSPTGRVSGDTRPNMQGIISRSREVAQLREAYMEQNIMVDALGRAVCAYKDENPVSLSVLGRQRIERFSEVLFDEERQGFYVCFGPAAPDGYEGRVLWAKLMQDAGHEDSTSTSHVPLGMWEYEDMRRVIFETYAKAVAAEVAVLNMMLRKGEFEA